MRPGPPYFFISLQKEHSLQSSLVHGSQFRHLTLLRRVVPDLFCRPFNVFIFEKHDV